MTLPHFLLASATSRWSAFGWRPQLPSLTDRFSVVRVLAFTSGPTVIGLGLGLVFDRLFFHHLVLWPVLLLGAFGICQGLVWYGLMALCWNQRAARLRANPSLDTNRPPARFVFFRGLAGLGYSLLLLLITPAAIVVTVENVRGEWMWKRLQSRLVAQGERLTLREILGPPIAAAENAGAAAVFAPFFDYTYEPQSESPRHQQAVWRDTNAVQRVEERLRFPEVFYPKSGKSLETTPKVDLVVWAEAYRKLAVSPPLDSPSWVKDLRLPTSTNNSTDAAQTVLAGLRVADAELAAFCAASALPRSQFLIHYQDAFGALLRHLACFKPASQKLQLRCAAQLEMGDISAAFDDAQRSIRVAELLREEPLLISQLVRYAVGNMAIKTVWQGLAEHRWTDAQLRTLQDQLARLDYLPGMLQAFEGERAFGILGLDRCVRGPDDYMMDMLLGDQPWPLPLALYPRVILRQNEISLVQFQSHILNNLRSNVAQVPQKGLIALIPTSADDAVELEVSRDWSPYRSLLSVLIPATAKVVVKTVRIQAIAQLAVIACALERYRLEKGAFPDKLDELAPAFLAQPPLDPSNRQPLHYRRNDDGWFFLYSVGPNGKDDGGVLKTRSNGEEQDWPWPVPTRPQRFNLF